MSPTLKHLSDALHIITRERKKTERLIQCSLTDITDSDENFERRCDNLAEQVELIQSQIDQLTRSRDTITAEYDRMVATREAGHDAVSDIRRKLKQLDLNEKTITLCILQQEAGL